jgi:NAD(P)-dependent dehydrogenase (short-subunit alcohol dehydrogenase family)
VNNIAWCAQHLPDLTGRTALVTGAASGLGFETALGLASRGADVWMADRNVEGGHAALARIQSACPETTLHLAVLDLGDLKAVKAFAADQAPSRLDILVNNAGLLPPLQRATTTDGFELKFGINVLGHFALTEALMPALACSEAPRVVWVSSLVHRRAQIDFDDLNAERDYDPQRAYNQAKLACLMLAMELHHRSRRTPPQLTAVAAHPGIAKTAIGRSRDGQRRAGIRDHLTDAAFWIAMNVFSQPQDVGARCLLQAAAGSNVQGGEFWGPDGFGEMRGAPTRVALSAPAQDADQRQRLWAACAAMVSAIRR